MKMFARPVIGVSGCLMGQNIRFDGGHKRSRLITNELAMHMDITTVCPEIGIGLGVPRPAIRLQRKDGETRLVMSQNNTNDLTERMNNYSSQTLRSLSGLDGFIFKKGSPTCGAYRVPVVVHKDGHRRNDGVGLFAKAFMQTYPWIPVEEEGRLNDAALRENFLERVYALQRWHAIPDPDNNISAFINFHARHKLMLMARSQVDYQYLGRWVAETTSETLKIRRQQYLEYFMLAMKKQPTRGRHINVLMHIMGYLKRKLTHEDKHELLGHFDSYRKSHLSLNALILLIKHHLRKYPDPYLEKQHYLMPYPMPLAG